MVVNGRPLKRAKKRVTADLYDFLTFPNSSDSVSGGLDGPFRLNVTTFLSQYARSPPPSSFLSLNPGSPNLLTWRISFRIGGPKGEDSMEVDPAVVDLDVVEEDVARSRSVYCDQCRVGGWSGHPVCCKRYHFIIRNPLSVYHQSCTRCRSLLQISDFRCATCNYEMTSDDFEDWTYHQLEDSTHLLHGVVHMNGYGHLLRVNGREGGSNVLTGSDIMDFWDRLCRKLRVRKVTVMDLSKKYGLEYRLLHAVTTGHPWYGDWGYEFGAGSFALTLEAYQKAVNTLSHLPLSLFFTRARSPRTVLEDTIALYCSLSECELVTVKDLFCSLLQLLQDARGVAAATTREAELSMEEKIKTKTIITQSRALCAWTKADVQLAESAMLRVLRAVNGPGWVSWRTLRRATCRSANSTVLLDYCMRGLGGRLTDDGMAVAVRCNAETNCVEFRLEAASGQQSSCRRRPSEEHLLRDLKLLYDSLLHPETMHQYKPQVTWEFARESALKLLDCKQFVKDYEVTPDDAHNHPFALGIWCNVELIDHPKDYTAPPPELLILPINATVADLKVEATRTFQAAYLIFQRFQAEQLLDCGDVADTTPVKLLIGSTGTVRVQGRCPGDHQRLGQFRMERGIENWTVDCACGAKDDDGERMLACDVCGVWQHTRCSGISDFEDVPAKFVCKKCVSSPRSTGGQRKCKNNTTTRGGGRCKDEMASSMIVPSMADAGRYGRSLTPVG